MGSKRDVRTFHSPLQGRSRKAEAWPAARRIQRSARPPARIRTGTSATNGRCRRDSRNSIARGTRSPATTTSDQKTAVYGPPRKLRAARRPRLAGGRPAEKEEDDQDELGADRDGVPADEELPLCFVQTEEEQRRGAGRDARREEERPEDRAIPREARGHRAEEEARVEAKADAHEDARHEDGAAVRACEVREPREKDTEEGRRPRTEPRALRRVERAEAEEEAGRVDEDENPRAPGHRRGRAKDGVKAPRPEPMREVEPERQHAHREERERRERRRPQGARERARPGDELQRGREDEDPRDDPAEEEVDRDLEAPDVERRVDLRIRAGRDGLEKLRRHGRSLRAGSRGSAARRSRGDSPSSGAFGGSSRLRTRGRKGPRRRASRSGTRSRSPA